MTILPTVYRKSSELTPTYDYVDFIQGVGYINLYAAAAAHASGVYDYFLTNQTISSSWEKRSATSADTNNETDLDFDITFQNPAVVMGKAVINFTVSYVDNTISENFTFTLSKVVGATETSIGTVTTPTESISGGAASSKRYCVTINTTTTPIGIGEKLRLTVLSSVLSGGAGGQIWFDPSSLTTKTELTTGVTIPTSLIIKVPFQLAV